MAEVKKTLIGVLGASTAALVVPLVISYEGTVTHSYKDPIGLVTACHGHTGSDIKMGQTFTDEQCRQFLESDLIKHAADLQCIKAPLAPEQRAAFLSFAYNVGGEKFCGSTLVRKANAGDLAGACNELRRWTMAGGKELPGLVKRREAERNLCMKGVA